MKNVPPDPQIIQDVKEFPGLVRVGSVVEGEGRYGHAGGAGGNGDAFRTSSAD